MAFRPFRTALVLGGGGARGLAHLGVLTALSEEGLAPDLIVGTSFGAIVGGSYALEPDAGALRSRFLELVSDEAVASLERMFDEPDEGEARDGWRARLSEWIGAARKVLLWNRTILARSVVDGVLVGRIIERLVGTASFSNLGIPFYAVAFDLNAGQDVVIGEGHLGTAIRASSAIPGVFAPVESGSALLVDGAVFQELPVLAARQLGADFVLAVDVGPESDSRKPSSGAEVLQRVMAVRGRRFRDESRALADVVVQPAVAGVHWSEFSRIGECHVAGVAALRESLSAIRSGLRRARYRSLLRRLAPAAARVEIARIEAVAEAAGDEERKS